LRETLGVTLAQDDIQMFARRLNFLHRILRYHAAIVFHFDFELIVRQNAFPELKDLGESIRFQPMIGVLTDVRLEQGRFVLPHDAAAIDKVFRHVPNFRDVSVRRNEVAIRKNKARESSRMAFEGRPKIREFHGAMYIPV
jgi:hypothetical protein